MTFTEMLPQEQPNYVGPEGPIDAPIALVGEAPGEMERKKGRPFIGPSGQELDRLLHSAGISRLNCYLTNVIKEQPPRNDITKFIDPKRRFISEAAQMYLTLLREELNACKANVIVAVGGTALYALTGNIGITKWRGSILNGTLVPGRKIVPTIHPRALLGPSGVYLWKHLVTFDLKRALEESKFPEFRLPSMTLRTRPSFVDAMHFLNRIKMLHFETDVDIEVLREEISCICFTLGQEVMSIPFVSENGNYFHPEEEVEIWRAIASILEDPAILKRGQNILFDASFLMQRHGIRMENVEDTMVAQGIVYPDFPKGLDFIATAYTKIPYYKDEGKKWSRLLGNWEQHWEYNCKDGMTTNLAMPPLKQMLEQQHNLETFKRQNALIEPLNAMQFRGIRMDLEGIKLAHESVEKALNNLTQDFYKTCGKEINPNSPKQLKEYFYGTLGINPYKNRKTGSDSVDGDALKRLSRKGFKQATILLEIRRLTKLKGTYLEIELDADGRLRCAFNPVGTQTGRLSSGKTIFGTGTNLQNQPPEMKQLMLFDDGYAGYNIDLSQAENRIVAYVGGVQEMIECFERGDDVHALTAGLIFGIDPDQIKQMDKEQIMADIGGGNYTHRFWGKKSNHALNYDMGYRTFSIVNEIQEVEGKIIVDRYHRAYPGVRKSYHEIVRAMLSKNRTVTNLMGRTRLFLDRWGDTLFKEAYAQIPQSTVADIINERGINYIYYDNYDDSFRLLELLLQVHDSIVFQIPLNLPWGVHEDILTKLREKLETPLRWRAREFVIPADIKVSFGNMGNYHKTSNRGGLRELPRTNLASALEQIYNERSIT